MKVDISRDSLICILSRNGLYYPCCSSQEEHVLKQWFINAVDDRTPKLLLARGACIETPPTKTVGWLSRLLLARGACIETYWQWHKCMVLPVAPRKRSMYWNTNTTQYYPMVSELLLARGACIETYTLYWAGFEKWVAPRKRSMYWNGFRTYVFTTAPVAPRKRSMYWNI